MSPARIHLFCALALLTGCWDEFGWSDTDEGPDPDTDQPLDGLTFSQVDLAFTGVTEENSAWGRLEVHPATLAATTQLSEGYLNATSAQGWVVRNVPVDSRSGPFSTYFDLQAEHGPDLAEIEVLLAYEEQPRPDLGNLTGDFSAFPLETFSWNAEGVSPIAVVVVGKIAPDGPEFPSSVHTSHTQPVTNQQAADMQCVPMSVANSLQFLEDEGMIEVPNDHDAGSDGDLSLVGQLDDTMDRTMGSGVWFQPMLDGKFQYLVDAGLAGSLNHRHQGRGWGVAADGEALPDGDYSANGITSTDDGDVVTGEWICDRIAEGCDVEILFSYDDGFGEATGGHAVRVYGCGKIGDSYYFRFAHDADQADDTAGLEEVFAWLVDADRDGMLNFASRWQEIRFAFAECPTQ
ncbi:MAG: hypothetical protein JRI25_09910 [Deltaproteobacteria bacterium]|nr:hypothetical protein [Deltaproteobacteria bacterium]MBW2254895.1 hypothetical protein [Deltaproteobacteria bacterium]